jgi:5-methylcytosine-specific restriction endonuclease McrA
MFNLFSKKIRFAVRSPRWSTIRKEFLKENPVCAACGSDKKLEVHHIEPVHINPDRELDKDNLITLCSAKCHLLFGHLMYFKSWNPEVEKDCKIMKEKIKQRK